MSTVTAIATSGLRAADAAMRTSAHNLANLQTEGFRRERVVHTAQADGGVMTSTVRAQEQGSSIHEDLVAQLQAWRTSRCFGRAVVQRARCWTFMREERPAKIHDGSVCTAGL